jgi:hypothetical protein
MPKKFCRILFAELSLYAYRAAYDGMQLAARPCWGPSPAWDQALPGTGSHRTSKLACAKFHLHVPEIGDVRANPDQR